MYANSRLRAVENDKERSAECARAGRQQLWSRLEAAAWLPLCFCVPSMIDSLEVQVLFTTRWR